VIGQDRPFSLRGIAEAGHPLASAKTLATEAAKQILGRCGNRKYRLHAGNRQIRPGTLRDGQPVQEFIRCNPPWGGIGMGDRGDEIQQVLTARFLDRLVERRAPCILYTHLGKLDRNRNQRAFSPEAVAAFRRLADYQDKGLLQVVTTARLLDRVFKPDIPAGGALCFPSF
jgi:hypothetical protein